MPDSEGLEDIAKQRLNAWFHVAVAPLLPRLFSGRFSAGLGARVAGVRSRGARCAMVSERGGGVAVVAVPAVAELLAVVAEVCVGLQQSAVNQQSLPTATPALSWGCSSSAHG